MVQTTRGTSKVSRFKPNSISARCGASGSIQIACVVPTAQFRTNLLPLPGKKYLYALTTRTPDALG